MLYPGIWNIATLVCVLCVPLGLGDYPCTYPYACKTVEECGHSHAGVGGVNQVLFRCSHRGAPAKVCCPPTDDDPRLPSAEPCNEPDCGTVIDNTPTPRPHQNNLGTSSRPAPQTKPTERVEPTRLTALQHRNIDLLPDTCGFTFTNKIINGANASLGEFPWMALIGYEARNGDTRHNCGGTLINDRYVLTAAHCLDLPNATLSYVRLGEYNIDSYIDCIGDKCLEPALDIPVEKIIPHERWSTTTLRNDIALLKLSRKVSDYNRANIAPICLPLDSDALHLTDDYKYEAVGWGLTHWRDDALTPIMQKVKLFGTREDQCNICKDSTRQSVPYCPLTKSQLCIQGTRTKDVCHGDSGGPLMTTDLLLTYQIGITSFKSTEVCGEENVPSIFTRVESYLDWILDHLEPE